jgi:hypothetical protein
MPFKSEAQRAYFNANRAKLESQGVNVDEWNAASEGKKLPQRVGKPKNKSKPKRNAAGYVPLTDLGM